MNFQTSLPDFLYQHAIEAAEHEHISLDQFLALAVAGQVASMKTRNSLEARAKRGNWAAFDRVMARVPDVEPEPHDRL